jgi:hypothetical protein
MSKVVPAALALLAFLGLAVKAEMPEIQRYLKVRKM